MRAHAIALFIAFAACTDQTTATDPAGGKADGDSLHLTDAQRETLVTKAATCPFMRTAVKQKALTVSGTVEHPVGVTADVVALGNAGGGDLGVVLKFFADINHNRIVGAAGATTTPVPRGTFGLWFPGSHGAHPGHSTILMGDPSDTRSGRFSAERIADLTTNFSTPYPDGKRYISLQQIGEFIAKNVAADPNSRGFNLSGIKALASEVANLATRALDNDPNLLDDVLHLFVTSNDLVNSCGEFSLLFTRFSDAQDADGNGLVSVDVVNALFRDGVFPPDWDQKPATAADWIANTLRIIKYAVFASWGF